MGVLGGPHGHVEALRSFKISVLKKNRFLEGDKAGKSFAVGQVELGALGGLRTDRNAPLWAS